MRVIHCGRVFLDIKKEKYSISKPVFYGACSKDAACVAAMGQVVLAQTCPNATYVEYDVGHWLIHLEAESLSRDLQSWIEDKVLPSA